MSDEESPHQAAARACRAGGGKAAISLSDPFCVDRHRDDFRHLVRELDIVFGNEHEWKSLYQTDDLGAALEQAACTECVLLTPWPRRRAPAVQPVLRDLALCPGEE